MRGVSTPSNTEAAQCGLRETCIVIPAETKTVSAASDTPTGTTSSVGLVLDGHPDRDPAVGGGGRCIVHHGAGQIGQLQEAIAWRLPPRNHR